MKVKKILFVGGPSDGYRKDDPRSSHQTVLHTFVPNPAWQNATYDALTADDTGGIQTCSYTIKKFRDEDGKEYEVAFDSSVKNPMEALIKGYRYHRNKRDRRKIKGIQWRKIKGIQWRKISPAPRYALVDGHFVRVK